MRAIVIITALLAQGSAYASDFWFPNHHGPGSSEIHFGCGDAECTVLSMTCDKKGTIKIGMPIDGEAAQDGQTIPIELVVGGEKLVLLGTVSFMGSSLSSDARASENAFRAMRSATAVTVRAAGAKIHAPLNSLAKGRAIFLNACGVPKS